MKFGVVTFPGSNCDQDLLYTFGEILGQRVVPLWHKDHDLKGCDFILLPGGFSYGDYLRSGSIAKFSPIMTEVIKHANDGGYVFGICNGFQILCESGLLEGALLHNNSNRFICDNVYIKAISKSCIVSAKATSKESILAPIAHGEGRFYASDDVIKSLEDNDQITFKYCDRDGKITEAVNPNGSVKNIAGITNKTKNVFGMMPHPERSASNILGSKDGLAVFEGIVEKALA
ncbi:phosphoribosylformylglycinamidine synthase I [Luteibaculum oceani]|uniref:Phosphoribosylformylglycinamidine synthase subunit PurQ n=1 Tax=Luteibaculum oceani TaxID=1294296 RepID=A0A5C6VJ24_9FLAO|nr:phosphoribosylformylglycinamidine synthase I [Luteibaculum oceani]TXC85197.1 phosphoribosylformylglycinamidine synthase I [Luteibaculum oceani]